MRIADSETGPVKAGDVGPKSPTILVFCVAARWMGPESLDKRNWASLNKSASSSNDVFPHKETTFGEPACETISSQSFFSESVPQSTILNGHSLKNSPMQRTKDATGQRFKPQFPPAC